MSPHLSGAPLARLEAVGFTPSQDLLVITEATVRYPLPEGVLEIGIEGFIPITKRRFEDPSDPYKAIRDYTAVYIDLLRALERNKWRHYRFPELTFDGDTYSYRGLSRIEGRVSLSLIR